MTRTHKANEIPHNVPKDQLPPELQDGPIPKYFGKHGFTDQPPTKIKKSGNGKYNWGDVGVEAEEVEEEIHLFKPRRRSNSMSHPEEHIVSKFEMNETFEEEGEPSATTTTTTTEEAIEPEVPASPGKA